MSAAPDGWLIHKAGCGWYRPNARGYTMNAADAGRYTYDDAMSYSHPNGIDGPRDGLTIKHESDLLRPSSTERGRDVTAPDVLRWHSHPDHRLRKSGDGINRHQPAVADLCHSLAARIGHPLHNSGLLGWALVHDEPEREMGDWPAPLALLPEFARVKRMFEREYRRRHGIPEPDMTVTEWHVFDLCDKAEARIWAAKRRADLTQYDWPEYDVRLQKMAAKIGPDATAWLAEVLG